MLVTLIKQTHIDALSLPEKAHGQYWLRDLDAQEQPFDLIAAEGVDGHWVMKSTKKAKLLDGDRKVQRSICLSPLKFYNLEIVGETALSVVYTEPVTEDRQIYRKYSVVRPVELTIGRVESSDIQYANRYVSSRHAVLHFREQVWSIADLGSTNGTFVNNRAVNGERKLNPGDVIYIMGMKLIVGDGFIACNNPDGQVAIHNRYLTPLQLQPPQSSDEEDEEEIKTTYFYRSPRFKRDIETAKFKIDSPPSNQIGDELPMALTIGPSITMGMASVATGSFTVVNAISNGNFSSAIPSLVMSMSMLLGTMLWPVITKSFEKKRKRKKEALRQKKYTLYLQNTQDQIDEEIQRQSDILKENSAPLEACFDRISEIRRSLWERSAGQNDFLAVRLGIGNVPLDAEISYAERRFTLEDDNLLEDMYQLCEAPKLLKDVPISLSLLEHRIAGVVGERAVIRAFARGVILQLAALYGYDEVKFVFLYDSYEENQFSFVKWLPHVWDDEKRFRFIATNNIELKEVSAYIERVIEYRQDLNDSDVAETTPYYVIFALSKDLAVRADMLKQLYSSKTNLNISVVACFETLNSLPKECSTVLEMEGSEGRLYNRNDTSGKITEFRLDTLVFQDLMPAAKQLANIPLDLSSGAYALPKMITFLELFGVGKVEHLNSLSRWKENDPTKSLEAAVGVNTLGDPFMLDLHQNFHGPHGLIAGMTGSGKSEFVMTYILSLAVNYHPNEVAFILIDYKGGGMAKTFEKLPHTAGIITNLDGNAIKRSLLSIESELKRREVIFSETGTKLNTSNLDIYKYQKLFREGRVSEPLPHLFIISDEFAELKTQQPEFMEHLVSAARIGRSLGVHLILATQKPAGVVDDQIWSNSKFRVCLKVQDRADSMDMLKRPDAAELTQTGRFYLQVGYNELFELGQSAWAGAPYYPADRVVVEKDTSIAVVDLTGHPIKQIKLDRHANGNAKAKKQIDAITEYIAALADETQLHARPLWLPPIAEHILMDDIRKEYLPSSSGRFVLNPLIGLYDDPAHQRQAPITLPLSQEGNAIIYGSAGNGKTSFINAMVYSLITENTPEEVNLYILDFASETLRVFSKAPHVGDVIVATEQEKVSNLFKMLLGEVAKRRKLFTQYGGEYQAYVENSGKTLPNLVVVIHNYNAFAELYEDKEDTLSFLSREGRKFGLYFVLSASATGAVRFRLLQNFKQLLTMQLNDENDYATVVGKTDGVVPAKCKGRGLVRLDNTVYEFQTAFMTEESVPTRYLQQKCEELSLAWHGTTAKRVPILPERVDVAFLQDCYSIETPLTVPIGVAANSLEVCYYSLSTSCVNLLLSDDADYEDTASAMAELMTVAGTEIEVFDPKGTLKCESSSTLCYHGTAKECVTALHELICLALERNHTIAAAKENNTTPKPFAQKILLINSLSELISQGNQEDTAALKVFLEKLSSDYNMYFIVGESVRNLTSYSFEKWYKKHITQSDCIWVGNGFSEQYQIKVSRQTPDLRDSIGSSFGFSVTRGIPTKVKLLRCSFEEE